MERFGTRIWTVLLDKDNDPQLGYTRLEPENSNLIDIMPEPVVMDQTESRCLIHFQPNANDGSKMRLDRKAGKGIRMLGNGTLEADGTIVINEDEDQELHIIFNDEYTIIFDCE